LNASAATNLAQATSELVALDVATGEVVWSREFDSPLFGGATAVGDLVFTATYGGAIVALRQADGTEVWRYETAAGSTPGRRSRATRSCGRLASVGSRA
jgi:outer membrane protein assembly factor BamB